MWFFKEYFGVLLDEAQDTNPVTFDIFMRIPAKKKVIVGDKHQNIYSWRGAKNYLIHKDFNVFYLTKTFRFGEDIASINLLYVAVTRAINNLCCPIYY